MNKIEIILNTPSNYYLDIGDFNMSLNYSFNDIKDITKRNGSYSKTLVIPSTKNNNFVLGGLFDINSDYTLFNPNKKIDAKILVNSEIVIEGFLHLTNIRKMNNVDSQGNLIYYDMVIYSNAINLLSEIGGKYLTEIVSLDVYNHIYNETNVVDSWTNTEGFVYPMYGLETDNNIYTTKNFYPSVFYKDVLDSIVKEAGYGWEGSLKTNAQFINEIIPYTGNGLPKISDFERSRKGLSVNITELTTVSFDGANIVLLGYWKETGLPNTTVTAPFDDIVDDPSNQFDNSNFEWDVAVDGEYKLDYLFNYDILWSHSEATTSNATNYKYKVIHEVQVKPLGGSFAVVDTVVVETFNAPSSIPSATTIKNNHNYSFETQTLDLVAGDVVKTQIYIYKTLGTQFMHSGVKTATLSTDIQFLTNNNVTVSSLTNTIDVGDVVSLSDFLPKLKQTDLITDLIKRYNLVIHQSPDNDNILVFDTYNDYYLNETEILDWSSKKDYSKEDNIKLLSELQYKKALFSYTADTTQNDYNVAYTGATNEIYGQFEIDFDNDFVKGQTDIISPFSPTPLTKTQFGAYTPAINRDNPIGNPRVLYYGGLKSLKNGNTFSLNSNSYSTYPYSGHFDDPINPNLDMNFDWCRLLGYNDWNRVTLNNQYNTYWSSYIKQIQNGKLLTAYFNLDETDIQKVKNNFAYKVWVKDAYYYINNIFDYNPIIKGVTKVELIKVDDLNVYVEEETDNISGGSTCPTDIYIKQYGDDYFFKSVSDSTIDQTCCESLGGTYNANGSCSYTPVTSIKTPVNTNTPIDNTIAVDAILLGDNNVTGGKTVSIVTDVDANLAISTKHNRQFILGNENNVTYDEVFVLGDSNEVHNDKAVILNGDNNVVKSSKTTLIGTNNQTIDDQNKVYLGNKFNVDIDTGEMTIGNEIVKSSQQKSVRITSAEILELDTTSIRLLDNSGTLAYYDIKSISVYLDYNTTVYTGDNDFQFYIDTAESDYFLGVNILTKTVSGVYTTEKVIPTLAKTQSIFNKALYVTLSNEPLDGDSDVIVTINYTLNDLNGI